MKRIFTHKAILASLAMTLILPPIATAETRIPLGPGDFTLGCAISEATFNSATSPTFYFLSEVGGCPALPCILEYFRNNNSAHEAATLVIDQRCTLRQPIIIPPRLTLAGVGITGEGALVFEDLPAGAAAISVVPAGFNGTSHITIRDLAIGADPAENILTGVDVSGGNLVYLKNVYISGFQRGVFGDVAAYSIFIDQSNISSNTFNVMIGTDANHWVIRDSVLGNAMSWSVAIRGGNNHVISGNRFEHIQSGAVWLGSLGAVVRDNRFETPGKIGVQVAPGAQGNRILANIFSGTSIVNGSASTQCCFNFIGDGNGPTCSGGNLLAECPVQ